jgi:hypothetical protein
MKALFQITCLALLPVFLYGQESGSVSATTPCASTGWQDTVAGIVTDSFFHRLGAMPMRNTRLRIPFQYVGKDPVQISRTWTNDPHYISSYPREPLEAGKWYQLEISFYLKDRPGYFSKMMGFILSNGENIRFKFTGTVLPDP